MDYGNNTDYIICSNCGAKNPQEAKFCSSCGTAIERPKVVEKVVEVIRCRKCGEKMSVDAQFCPSCGTPVFEQKETQKSSVQRCPICGEIVESNALRCPCGHEVRGREAVKSLQDFFHSVSLIEDESKKIEAIKLYVIPNNKEDIMEFMIQASSVFDSRVYTSNKYTENEEDAWLAKIKQCYKKIQLMVLEPSEKREVEKLYREIISKVESTQKAKIIMIVSGIVLILASVLMVLFGSGRDEAGEIIVTPVSTIGLFVLAGGILLLVFGLRKKKTRKQIEEARIAKMNKQQNKENQKN